MIYPKKRPFYGPTKESNLTGKKVNWYFVMECYVATQMEIYLISNEAMILTKR